MTDVLLLDRRTTTRWIPFLGLNFTVMDPETLFKRVCEAASLTDEFRYMVTPNVDQIVRLQNQPHLKSLYDEAWLTVNDSRILDVLAQWSGLRLPACPGSDLVKQLLDRAINPDEPLVIIGGSKFVIDAVSARYGLSNIQWHLPPMGLARNLDAVQIAAQFCVDHPARFIFICVGNPQQEMVAQAIKATGRATGIGLCVGASLEFIAGTRQRAPLWMQKLRFEWLFRLASEPQLLWRRYLVEGPKVIAIWWKWRATSK